MPKKQANHKKLDTDTINEITLCVIDALREEESKLAARRHDRMRANIKLTLRRYREIKAYADNAVYSAMLADDDFTLRDLLDIMSGRGREAFRVESIKDSAAKARVMVDHMDKMLDIYKLMCEHSGKEEDLRRYRVLRAAYLDPDRKDVEDIAKCEFVDRSTVYRDLTAAAEYLAVLFFGLYGLEFL